MPKLREETRKAKEKLKNAGRLGMGTEPDCEIRMEEAHDSLHHVNKCMQTTRRMLSEDVAANGGEPLARQCCEVCFEPFDKQQRIPKDFECCHTICERCLYNLPFGFMLFYIQVSIRQEREFTVWRSAKYGRVKRANLTILDLMS